MIDLNKKISEYTGSEFIELFKLIQKETIKKTKGEIEKKEYKEKHREVLEDGSIEITFSDPEDKDFLVKLPGKNPIIF